ncbi:hypothetical protein MKW98_025292 [Papaver atlanticum]|uniref:Uncharacterized protein n=1 Tax=Papaver atlanticum TaxID=357466 RepID=A0AAD4SKC8_9MAGN|nr:hypothetical protein MKW98_025292 [Papaver atlanticum]
MLMYTTELLPKPVEEPVTRYLLHFEMANYIGSTIFASLDSEVRWIIRPIASDIVRRGKCKVVAAFFYDVEKQTTPSFMITKLPHHMEALTSPPSTSAPVYNLAPIQMMKHRERPSCLLNATYTLISSNED